MEAPTGAVSAFCFDPSSGHRVNVCKNSSGCILEISTLKIKLHLNQKI